MLFLYFPSFFSAVIPPNWFELIEVYTRYWNEWNSNVTKIRKNFDHFLVNLRTLKFTISRVFDSPRLLRIVISYAMIYQAVTNLIWNCQSILSKSFTNLNHWQATPQRYFFFDNFAFQTIQTPWGNTCPVKEAIGELVENKYKNNVILPTC